MTHKKLLEQIDTIDIWLSTGQIHKDAVFGMANAIRTIIELHNLPNSAGGSVPLKYCRECGFPFPCPTIEAVKKALQ